MVTLSVTQKDIFLVSPTYYKEEIDYQRTLNALNKTPQNAISIIQTKDSIRLIINEEVAQGLKLVPGKSVKVEWKRPDNASLDVNLGHTLSGAPINMVKPKSGQWNVKVSWGVNQEYVWLQTIYLN
jgi:hypothetical protein